MTLMAASIFTFCGSGFSHIAERQTRVTVIVKATGEGSESSTSLSIVKSVQNVVSFSLSLSLSLSLSYMVKIFQINDEKVILIKEIKKNCLGNASYGVFG